MTVERLIKRTIWEATCPACEAEYVAESTPPKAKLCTCGKEWLDFKEVVAIGPDLGLPGYKRTA